MSFTEPHEIHKRRFGRNLGLGIVLVAFVALVFGLTVVKVTMGEPVISKEHYQDAGLPAPDAQ